MHRTALLACLWLTVMAASGVHALEEPGWRDSQGRPIPDSAHRKSSRGFGGNVILTTEADWQEKWSRPEPPRFTTTDQVKLGEDVMALVFFVNPGADAAGNLRILCDYRVTRPDGTVSQEVKGETCASGPLVGSPLNVRLVEKLIGFVGESADPEGTWSIEVRLTDAVKKATVDLVAKFDYRSK